MQKNSDIGIEAVRLASNLPAGTVVIVAKSPTSHFKLHTVLSTKEVQSGRLSDEVQELLDIFESDNR